MINLTRLYLNVLSVNPSQQYKITVAKRDYKTVHSECAICGNKQYIEVHHVIPVHIDINLSANPTNFISLCDAKNNGCHRWIGHLGDFRYKWNIWIRHYAIASRLCLQKIEPNREFIIPTEYLIKEFASALNISELQLLEEVLNFNK